MTARLERCWFPTKEYDGFALPAGEYTALRVVIGEGQGQNWWVCGLPASLSGGRLPRRWTRQRRRDTSPGPGCPNHRGGPGLCAGNLGPWSCWGVEGPPVPLKNAPTVVGQFARSVPVTSGKAGR